MSNNAAYFQARFCFYTFLSEGVKILKMKRGTVTIKNQS